MSSATDLGIVGSNANFSAKSTEHGSLNSGLVVKVDRFGFQIICISTHTFVGVGRGKDVGAQLGCFFTYQRERGTRQKNKKQRLTTIIALSAFLLPPQSSINICNLQLSHAHV